jgi:hypothetical protein
MPQTVSDAFQHCDRVPGVLSILCECRCKAGPVLALRIRVRFSGGFYLDSGALLKTIDASNGRSIQMCYRTGLSSLPQIDLLSTARICLPLPVLYAIFPARMFSTLNSFECQTGIAPRNAIAPPAVTH